MSRGPDHRVSGEAVAVSALLADLPRQLPPEPRFHDLLGALGDRGVAAMLTAASIPPILPTPGLPVGVVFGAVLILISVAMIAGRETLVLPNWLGRRAVGHTLLDLLTRRGVSLLERLERRSAQRWPSLVHPAAVRWLGLVVAVMGTLISLPIPFGNLLPALAALLIGLGLGMRDGGAVGAGLALALLSVAVSVALVLATYHLAVSAFG